MSMVTVKRLKEYLERVPNQEAEIRLIYQEKEFLVLRTDKKSNSDERVLIFLTPRPNVDPLNNQEEI